MTKKKELVNTASLQIPQENNLTVMQLKSTHNKKIFTLTEAAALGLEGMLAERQKESIAQLSQIAECAGTGISLEERINKDYTLYSLDNNSAACYYGVEILEYDDIGVNPFRVRKYFVCTDFEKPAAELQPGHQYWKIFKDANEYLAYMKQHNILLNVESVPYHEEIWYQYKGVWYRRVPVTADTIIKTFDGRYRCNLIDINLPEDVLKRIYEDGYSENIEQEILGRVNEGILEYRLNWNK